MLSDIEICRHSELQPITTVAASMGLLEDEFQSLGKYKAKVSLSSLKRLNNSASGKLVVVTAITPTPLGEGKTVTTIGLSQGLKQLNRSVVACIRQPSMGPVFGV
ncbi:formate--tetrahydrofolate ligase, partial [Vibrio genomosp. F10]